ncbi:MAG: MHS family MFS transporter [Planctomycetes bacterium]|nr:MHS family MFS transporter [Planctomycetota bacterium]
MPMQPEVDRRTLIEAVVASTIGTTIEWYDFFLYGLVAGMVFGKVFFPNADPFTGTILAFATYGVGFLARPLGGVIFGYMGDRVGRKSMIVTPLLLMGGSTLIIGFLPTYAEIGVAAPILLTVLRFVQGLGVGGEWGGAVLLALEYTPGGRRGFFASWPQAGVPLGLLSAAGAVALCQGSMEREDFETWGWRVPFYFSGALIVVGLLIRVRIMETPLFAALQEKNEIAEAPISETIREHWLDILLVAGARITENAAFYLFTAWAVAYDERHLKLAPAGMMLLAVNIAAGIELITIPFFGWLSDRLSRRAIYIVGCVFLLAFAFPYYALLETREPIWVVAATVGGLCIGHAMLYSVQASLIPELFGTRVRCTGASIGYQLAVPLSGGIAPILATFLLKYFENEYWPLATYIVINTVISLACVLYLAETSHKDIGE